ncbi:MAG TPA: glycosyltransferase [Chitinophagaceae bacterium]|nr:glycosyltransferase [Chitinophagaceae bacterium]
MKKIRVNKKFIVFLGYSSFPYGLAEVQKIILISKSLLLTGNHVTVICRNGTHKMADRPEMKVSGVYENIEYIYTSGSCFRDEHFFKRRLFELKGKINEALFLRKKRKNKELDFAILSTRSFYAVLYYCILAKLLGFKTILNYVEYYSGIKKNWSQIGRRLNDWLFDRYAPLLTDAVFPISEFIINHIKGVSPAKKYLKIPGLTNFEKYNDIETLQGQPYFLFCGDAGYKEIIYFIIDSFLLLNNNTSVYLYLVIGGNENNILEIKKYISDHNQNDKIRLFSKLTEKQLYSYYKNAIALLIPLRPTSQDLARFPHKTGEYLASGNPVISTNYGEVKYYFKDMENMLLANSYDKQLFAEKMQFVINNPVEARKIGLNGKNKASEIFDYRTNAVIINNFLDSES